MARARNVTSVPYATARSGAAARDEITAILRRFGCTAVGFTDDFDSMSVWLEFQHRGRGVQLRASAKGWAAMFLRAKPYTSRRRASKAEYEAAALRQGLIAINSILRDWVKGQVTAIECGAMPFDAVFMPYMLTNDGRTFFERASETRLLPAPR
jgi:hypothetical protein